MCGLVGSRIFFFNDTATTEIYTLSLHDALPIYQDASREATVLEVRTEDRPGVLWAVCAALARLGLDVRSAHVDRKSTRLNSSHANISYAVFCLKKKKAKTTLPRQRYSPTPDVHA